MRTLWADLNDTFAVILFTKRNINIQVKLRRYVEYQKYIFLIDDILANICVTGVLGSDIYNVWVCWAKMYQ